MQVRWPAAQLIPLGLKTMIILDCENRSSAAYSLSCIYKVPEQELDAFLKGTDLDRHYEENETDNAGDRELTLLFERAFGCIALPIDRICWFHLTRASADADFMSGIFPLNEALPIVWDTIIKILQGTAHEAPLCRLKKNGVPNFHYQHKVGRPMLAGPYAMLVKETAFRSREMGNHDYLGLPEIVEDICNGYHNESGVMIHDIVRISLVPYIIKFWSSEIIGKSCIESALYYLYRTTHGHSLSINANTCFDGRNRIIPREQIVKVETVGVFS